METLLSIVIPAYNEEHNLVEILDELTALLPVTGCFWEIIFVDDGSSDRTWQVIHSLCDKDVRVRGVRLSRNFGHQYALYAGLCHATGDAVVSMDADSQHPPETVLELVDAWRKGSKIVHTRRVDPSDYTFFKKYSSKLYYRLFSFLAGVSIHPGMADFRLLDRQVVDELRNFGEEGLFLRGMVQWVGYPSSTVSFRARNRRSGASKYTWRKMFKLAFSGISSFSIIPLRISMLIGIFTSFAACCELLYAVGVKLFGGSPVPGWTSVIVVLTFLFGILFILLGVIGEYIGRILIQVQGRPRFLVQEIVGGNHTPEQKSYLRTQ